MISRLFASTTLAKSSAFAPILIPSANSTISSFSFRFSTVARSSTSLFSQLAPASILTSALFVSIFLISSVHSCANIMSAATSANPEDSSFNPAASAATIGNSAGTSSGSIRMPPVYLGHGGGPCFFMDASDGPFEGVDRNSKATAWLKANPKELGFTEGGKYGKPKALLIFSAHWESNHSDKNGNPIVYVTSQEKHPELYYDYGGFPSYTYEIEWPAPGNPKLASKIVSLLNSAGISAQEDKSRNFDHGTFIPMKLWFPTADIPTVQVSLHASLDPIFHEKVGSALSSLRDEGVLIIGSGMAGHGFRITKPQLKEFIDTLTNIVEDKKLSSEERLKNAAAWKKFPNAKLAHPREEHLIPIYAVMGAAKGAPGRLTLKESYFGRSFMPLHTYIFDE